MQVVLGLIVVVAAVFGGFHMFGGDLSSLWQPGEIIIIVGAAIGAFVVANNARSMRATLRALPRVLHTSRYNRALYMDVMALLYGVLSRARKEGLMAIEAEIEKPVDSALFTAYPRVLADAVLVEFLTDYLRLMLAGKLSSHEIEALMEQEIATFEQEYEAPAMALSRVGDGLPAFGIVAAVMGVVHALSVTGASPAELSSMISDAMMGTFLGILLAYGVIAPLASRIEQQVVDSAKMFQCIKVTLLASMNGCAPQIAVEFGRKVLYSSQRPSFGELDELVREVRARHSG